MLSLLPMFEVARKSFGGMCLDFISNLSLIGLLFHIHPGPQERRSFSLTFPIWRPWRPTAQISFTRPCLGKHRWRTASRHHPMSTEVLFLPGCPQPVTGPAPNEQPWYQDSLSPWLAILSCSLRFFPLLPLLSPFGDFRHVSLSESPTRLLYSCPLLSLTLMNLWHIDSHCGMCLLPDGCGIKSCSLFWPILWPSEHGVDFSCLWICRKPEGKFQTAKI